jgi:ABC-type branched-subunit amino acid transport system substrate-binding protein
MYPIAIKCCGTSAQSKVVGVLAGTIGVPVVSNHAASPSLYPPGRYPTLSRANTKDLVDATALVDYAYSLGAAHFVCVFIKDAFGNHMHASVLREASKLNI